PASPARTEEAPADASPADASPAGPTLEQALEQVVTTLDALCGERDEDEHIWGSMIKQALRRRNPGFNERAHGFRSFNELLREAEKRGLLQLEADEKSGGYKVEAVD
ncbi:MAG TPA: OST-HTH/LOTUS domain-containing protein, partial [Verrucomicrobiales bacterium]|nr:OST-HTH/LOTUS domain-containing protein [Verrucomicrobiales bacterium]